MSCDETGGGGEEQIVDVLLVSGIPAWEKGASPRTLGGGNMRALPLV